MLSKLREHQDQTHIPLMEWHLVPYTNPNGQPRLHPTRFDLSEFLSLWLEVEAASQKHPLFESDRFRAVRETTIQVVRYSRWKPSTSGTKDRTNQSIAQEIAKRVWNQAKKFGHREGAEDLFALVRKELDEIEAAEFEQLPSLIVNPDMAETFGEK
jgi:hypothetical protein